MIQRGPALTISKIAARVLADKGAYKRLDDGYTRVDPIAIAESEDIDVMARPMDKLLGAFLREERVGILLNSDRPTGMLHMTCAHELGHFYLGHETTADMQIDYQSKADNKELTADFFAHSLMAPLRMVTNVLNGQCWKWQDMREPAIVYQLSLRLGLSYTAMVWSLVRMKRLDDATAKKIANVQPAQLKQAIVPKGTILKPTQDVWHIGPRDKDFILEPRPNDRMFMDLESHASAGYLWTVDEAAAEGYRLKLITVDGGHHSARGTANLPVGGSATVRYELQPKDPDALNVVTKPELVEFKETQPWNRSASEPTKFALKTQFEVLPDGLAEATRERLVQRTSES